jgi:hypothetical protein
VTLPEKLCPLKDASGELLGLWIPLKDPRGVSLRLPAAVPLPTLPEAVGLVVPAIEGLAAPLNVPSELGVAWVAVARGLGLKEPEGEPELVKPVEAVTTLGDPVGLGVAPGLWVPTDAVAPPLAVPAEGEAAPVWLLVPLPEREPVRLPDPLPEAELAWVLLRLPGADLVAEATPVRLLVCDVLPVTVWLPVDVRELVWDSVAVVVPDAECDTEPDSDSRLLDGCAELV